MTETEKAKMNFYNQNLNYISYIRLCLLIVILYFFMMEEDDRLNESYLECNDNSIYSKRWCRFKTIKLPIDVIEE